MKKILIPIIALIGIGLNAFAGDKSTKELRGDKYFFVYSFEKAIDSYSHAKNLSAEGQRRLAASYTNTDQNILSEAAYAKLISLPSGVAPNDYFNYAMILKSDGKYEESNKFMDKFQELMPNDLRAKDYAAHKAEFAAFTKDEGKYKIGRLNVNTDAEDFGPAYYKDKIVFTSSGAKPDLMKKTYNWNGKPFLNMYVSEVAEGQLKEPVIFDKGLNGKMHDGPASFSKDGNYMAFSRNHYDLKRKDRVVNIEICFSSYKDGKWSAPEPFALNNKAYSVGHPCLTSDGSTMYFSSDMPGGFGGADIYTIKKNAVGEWGKAENMGDKVNTEGDELYPFFEENNDMMFFSSNGRFGLGGLDIFICSMKDSKVDRVYNAGVPLNSQYDDFSVIVNDKVEKGYFASNRTGGGGSDDIYSLDLFLNMNKKITGIAKNKDGNAIPNTFIALLDEKENVIDTVTTKEDGAYSFSAATNKNYKLVGTKSGYLDGNAVANTFGKELIVIADITLLQKEVIAETIKPGVDLGKVLALNSIYFDLDKSNIRPDAQVELNKIVKVMNEHPDMVVELKAYADCRASKEYNQVLSNKRATASAEYIKRKISKPERINGKGYGKTQSVNSCGCEGEVASVCTEDQFQKDRRTEFIIIGNNEQILSGRGGSSVK